MELQHLEQLLKEECWTFAFYLSEICSVFFVNIFCVGGDRCSVASEVRVLFVSLLYSRTFNSRNVHDVKTS